MNPMIKTVSFSRLQDFEKCKYLAKLKYVDRIPEPERPLPTGKTEHANDRGTRVHEAAELFIRGGVELIKELDGFRPDYEELRTMFAAGAVTLEGEWAVDRNWTPVAWNSSDAWCRMKLDAFAQTSPTTARVIDYKTGKRYGNEVKHTEQGQVYQLATFLRFPELEAITVEFWYVDIGEKDIKHYTRAQGAAYFDKYNNRFAAVTGCAEFPPNPNAFSCKWCPYKGNACEYGVTGVPSPGAAQARFRELKRERFAV
jgi:RecB family exonuclease